MIFNAFSFHNIGSQQSTHFQTCASDLLFLMRQKQAPERAVLLPVGITLLNSSVPMVLQSFSHSCDRCPGATCSAGLKRLSFPGSCLECATSSHLRSHGLNAKTVSLRIIFSRWLFPKPSQRCGS